MTLLIRNSAWQGILTPREAEVLELLAAGHTDAMIAAEHWTTTQTVKYHTQSIYRKLGVRCRESRDGVSTGSTRVLAARWWWQHCEQPCA